MRLPLYFKNNTSQSILISANYEGRKSRKMHKVSPNESERLGYFFGSKDVEIEIIDDSSQSVKQVLSVKCDFLRRSLRGQISGL